MIAVGLLATLAAAVLSTDKPIGAATLEWVEEAPMADSKPAAIPGGGQMRLSEAEIRSTEPNVSDYTLFRVSAVLTIDAGSAIGHGRLRCAVHVPSGRSSPRPRRAAPSTRAPAKTCSNRTRRKPRWSSSARTAPTSPRSKSATSSASATPRSAASSSSGRPTGSASRSGNWACQAAVRKKTWNCPSSRSGARPRSPPPRCPARSRPRPARPRSAPRALCPA